MGDPPCTGRAPLSPERTDGHKLLGMHRFERSIQWIGPSPERALVTNSWRVVPPRAHTTRPGAPGSDGYNPCPEGRQTLPQPTSAPLAPRLTADALDIQVIPTSPGLSELDLPSLVASALALLLAGCFATLRRAMAQSVAERVLARTRDPAQRARVEPLLARLGPLTASAHMFETAFALLVPVLFARALTKDSSLTWETILVVMVLSLPALWLTTQALAQTLALRAGDALLIRALPGFRVLQLPLAALVWTFEGLRRGLMRAFGLRDHTEQTRELVADLSGVIADSELSGKLDATEREIIGNVMEVRDVDVAAVMTPRTAIQAVEASASVLDAARIAGESGYSRLPVYEEKLDSIIGTISARDLVQVLANGSAPTAPATNGAASAKLREILHPAFFVPETKRISQLLAEFRREKLKMAIVLDEYGGTAGLVTLGDILTEIVGDLKDESDEEAPSPLKRLADGAFEVEAGMHVTEVNEALGLDLPEEADFETLGGFVLAELGRFPQRGESFVRGDTEFTVLESNDRRVLRVRVRRLETSPP
jgi:magnesium and cobalt exporter, CNNM family